MFTLILVFSHCTCRCLICGISGVASGQESSPPPIPPPWGGPYAGGGGRWLGGPYTARCSRGNDAESTSGASPWAPYEKKRLPCNYVIRKVIFYQHDVILCSFCGRLMVNIHHALTRFRTQSTPQFKKLRSRAVP
jgi:hypothetical protein